MKLVMSDRPLSDASANHPEVTWIDLSAQRIGNCIGCFGCWTKTPGRCVIRDDATKIYPLIARSDTILYVSRVKYGGYDTIMKTMLERAIPVQQAFIRLHGGQTHHVQRDVVPKTAIILAYGATDREEQELFEQLVARNAYNMNFATWKVRFCAEADLEDAVNQEVETWSAS